MKTGFHKIHFLGRYPNDSYAGGNPWQVIDVWSHNTDYEIDLTQFSCSCFVLCWLSASTPEPRSPSRPSSGTMSLIFKIKFDQLDIQDHFWSTCYSRSPRNNLIFQSHLWSTLFCRSLGDFPLSREEHGRWMDLLYVIQSLRLLMLFFMDLLYVIQSLCC